jgi:hypothetical protein
MEAEAGGMEDVKTWRDLLKVVVSDTRERQRIAGVLNVNPVTLARWIGEKSNPRLDHLRPLINAMPHQHRQQLAELIAREFPLSFNTGMSEESMGTDIPSLFYTHILHKYSITTLQTRVAVIGSHILNQIVQHIDPYEQGMLAYIAACMPPEIDNKIVSLRKTISFGTTPWQTFGEQEIFFLGAESQAGYALATRHPIIIQNPVEKKRLFPYHSLESEGSSAAYPILLADQTAGSLYVTSTQPNHFTQLHLDLLQKYAELLVLAFRNQDFYPLSAIELSILPPKQQQATVINTFQQRVTEQILQAMRNNTPINRLEAESITWKELEHECLSLPYTE